MLWAKLKTRKFCSVRAKSPSWLFQHIPCTYILYIYMVTRNFMHYQPTNQMENRISQLNSVDFQLANYHFLYYSYSLIWQKLNDCNITQAGIQEWLALHILKQNVCSIIIHYAYRVYKEEDNVCNLWLLCLFLQSLCGEYLEEGDEVGLRWGLEFSLQSASELLGLNLRILGNKEEAI